MDNKHRIRFEITDPIRNLFLTKLTSQPSPTPPTQSENLVNVAILLSKIGSPSTYKFSASVNESSFPSNFPSIGSMDCLKPIYCNEKNKFLGMFMHNVGSTFQTFLVENTSN